jgi:6-pyruvoyl-tetrahydropterin synthase
MSHESFRVHVTKDYLKFSAAHFIAYPGVRERLHGHNYRVSIALDGQLGPQGYVVDFGVVKRIARRLCERLDERLLVPERSDCLRIRENGTRPTCAYEADDFSLSARRRRAAADRATPRSRSWPSTWRRAAPRARRRRGHAFSAIEVGVEEELRPVRHLPPRIVTARRLLAAVALATRL